MSISYSACHAMSGNRKMSFPPCRLNASYQTQPFGYGFKPNLFTPNNAAGMQLVPYTQPESEANQKVPLTREKLDNLYKMNYAVQPYAGIANPNVYPYTMPRPVAPPAMFYSGNSSPVAFTPTPSLPVIQQQQQQLQHQQQQLQQQQQQLQQQKPMAPMNTSNYGQSMGSAGYASTSNASQQFFNPNVINPQSALVHVPKVCIHRIAAFLFA